MTPLRCENLSCTRKMWNAGRTCSVSGFSAVFAPGEVVCFRGGEGCGKNLLLHVLGMIEEPDSGILEVLGERVSGDRTGNPAAVRDRAFGYIFPHPHLLPTFTVAENIAMPFFRIEGRDAAEARRRTAEALDLAGATGTASAPAEELDGEESWRVAFARAIVHSPPVLVAFWPPNPLLLPLAKNLARVRGTTVLWTGDGDFPSHHADRVFDLAGGVTVEAHR
jgi:ABC-type lipoprotein export system ATPase subunit